MYFKRKVYNELLNWKEKYADRYAVLLEGARRVGKSTIAEQFAINEYKSYVLIDFSNISDEVMKCFDDIHNPDMFFLRLQAVTGIDLYLHESVVIFDEVQLFPKARQAIKHLVKDGRYDYIETGSLLSLKKNIKGIVIPSEEHAETLYPLDFEEFYWAIGNTVSPGQMHDAFMMKRPMGEAVHRRWMRDLRLYMLVGGMPQAVEAYLQSNDMSAVDEVKRGILEIYESDFFRIDPSGRASKIFSAIPAQLNSNASRYQFGKTIKRQSSDKTKELIAEIESSKTVTIAHHANDPQVGMGMFADFNVYKMFLADTGLFVTLAFKDKLYTENEIYRKLLSDKLESNMGYVYENLVAQMLKTKGYEVFYYTFPTENKHNYEIDFLLTKGKKIVPIEVKSSGYKTHKSLDMFCEKFSSRIGERILLYTKDYQKDGPVTCLPIYYTPFL